MERSLHSRGFRTPCTFRHRCRQSPQRSIRFPSRSMWMIMYLSVSSTLVTVCAFNLSCFLRNVSMSTSILFLSVAVHHSPQKIRCIGDSDQPLHRQPAASKTLRLQLHFRDGNLFLVSFWGNIGLLLFGEDVIELLLLDQVVQKIPQIIRMVLEPQNVELDLEEAAGEFHRIIPEPI